MAKTTTKLKLKAKRRQLVSSPLVEMPTNALIVELRRRASGLVLAVMTFDSTGDHWRTDAKGSQEMLMALLGHLENRYLPDADEENDEPVHK